MSKSKKKNKNIEIIRPKYSAEGLGFFFKGLLVVIGVFAILVWALNVQVHNRKLNKKIEKQQEVIKRVRDSVKNQTANIQILSNQLANLNVQLNETQNRYLKIEKQYRQLLKKDRLMTTNVSNDLKIMRTNLYNMNRYIKSIEGQLGIHKGSAKSK